MGLTNNQKQLIEEVAKGDMGRIKQCAIACLAEDNTSKNKSFCQAYLKRLKNQPTLIELPANLHQLAIAEDVSLFNERRYYISSREREIIENIKRSVLVSQKMLELGIRKSNATLLHGKSGTGKTTFAKYIAKTLDLPFIYLNFTNLIDSYMGKTSQNIGRAGH